jgi:hypothetical protein
MGEPRTRNAAEALDHRQTKKKGCKMQPVKAKSGSRLGGLRPAYGWYSQEGPFLPGEPDGPCVGLTRTVSPVRSN